MNLERLFAYDHWANREEATRLRQIGAPAPPMRVLNHIVGADWLWLCRVRNENPKLAIWPELSIDDCEREIDTLREAFDETLRMPRDTRVEYRNSKGEPWSSSLDDVLTHIITHSAYHRGQIATLVRQGGETPAYTDLIHAVRNKFV